jgi:CDP-glucose 4,6-dehydratase
LSSNKTVADLVLEILKHWPGTWEDRSDPSAPHEAVKLNLSTDKAFHMLQWRPRWDFGQTVRQTIEWYRSAAACHSSADFRALTSAQINAYQALCADQLSP